MTPADIEHLLEKVLLLERSQGFRNRSMAGGLSAYSRRLNDVAAPSSRVPEIALLLESYDGVPLSQRSQLVARSLSLLTGQALPAPVGKDIPPPLGKRKNVVAASIPSTKRKKISRPATLDADLETVKGVPIRFAEALKKVGVVTVHDLLRHLPREHIDYSRRDRIRSLRRGDRATIVGTIESVRLRRIRGGLSITTARIADDSGRIAVNWFNQPYLARELTEGRRIAITGEVELFDGRAVFAPRDFEWVTEEDLTHASRMVPIYALTQGVHQKQLRKLVHRLLMEVGSDIPDFLPQSVLVENGLMEESRALSSCHFPESEQTLQHARSRLAFDELLLIQLGLLARRQEASSRLAPALGIADRECHRFVESLPFKLTAAQSRVMEEIKESICRNEPMTRLLQGDVGSGKTVLAAFAIYAAALRGYQACLMAPTEILARQHYISISSWLKVFGIDVQLLVGSSPKAQRSVIQEHLRTGDASVLIGTHTLFQDGLEVPNLAVVVVDEQHRFGVEQRTRLRDKAETPHLLSMTATPIPRTLALTLFCDLDISVLDEVPPGRQPVNTSLTGSPSEAYTRIQQEIELGHQAFVICPLVEASSQLDVQSAEEEHAALANTIFPSLSVGLLHGQMPARNKEEILLAFRAGQYNVLVATSLIEVGIDIPNATVMVIRDAHRFGLAQLHQLRGRVGRGGTAAYCILVSGVEFGPSRERLIAMVQSNDGFALAEKDLEIRGPGEFWGMRQSGIPELEVASLADAKSIERARRVADEILTECPRLNKPSYQPLQRKLNEFWNNSANLH